MNRFRSPASRHQHILKRLQEEGEIQVAALPAELGVTAMTVWRDLRALEEQGLCRRQRGVILSLQEWDGEHSFERKTRRGGSEKRRIAELAACEFIQEGEVIALEGGTTVAALVDALPDRRISLLTNSLPIALRIRKQHPDLPLRVLGGWLSSVSGNTTGPDVLRELERCSFTTCFLSCTGWDPELGPMDPNPLEIEVKRAMAARSRRVILLMDAAKFARASGCVMMHPRRIHCLITQAPPPDHARDLLRQHGVQLRIADTTVSGLARTTEVG